MGTPKLQLFTEQLLMKKMGNYQKTSSTTKDIKKEPQEEGIMLSKISQRKTNTVCYHLHVESKK